MKGRKTAIVRWSSESNRAHAETVPFFPILRTLEIPYSGIARFHFLTGNINGQQTLRLTIGVNQMKARTAAFPSYLRSFVERLPNHHPNRDIAGLLKKHTAVPMLTYFLEEPRRDAVIRYFLNGSVPQAFAMLGFTKNPHMQTHRSLAMCLKCCQEDEADYGIAHWHAEHQCPGSFVCHRHGESLIWGCVKCGPFVASVYTPVLPSSSCSRKGHKLLNIEPPPGVTDDELRLMAAEARALLQSPSGFGAGNWVEATRDALTREGCTRQTILNHKKILDLLQSKYSDGLLKWIGCLSRSGRRVTPNPWILKVFNWRSRAPVLDCMIMTLAMSESVSKFEGRVGGTVGQMTTSPCPPIIRKLSGSDALKVRHDLMNLSRIAAALGKNPEALIREGQVDSASTQSRKDLRDRFSRTMIAAANSDFRRDALSRHLGVQERELRRFLNEASQQGRGVERRRGLERERERTRALVASILKSHPKATLADLSRRMKGRVTWMRTCDREWFEAHAPKGIGRGRRTSSVERSEDEHWANKLQEAYARLLQQSSMPRISESRLVAEAGLGSRYRINSEGAHKCQKFLQAMIETPEQHWRRRISRYVAIAGAKDPIVTFSRIRIEHSVPADRPAWIREFVRTEALRQGFQWIPKRHRQYHAAVPSSR